MKQQNVYKPGERVEVLVDGEWHEARIESYERSFYTVSFDPPITVQKKVPKTERGGFLFLRKITTAEYKKVTIERLERVGWTRVRSPAPTGFPHTK